MGRLTCPCLNVSVHYKGGSWDSRPVAARRLFPEGSTDRLSGETVCEVELDVAGVTMVSQLSVCETAAAMSDYVAWRGVAWCSQAAAYIELDHNHSWSGSSSPDPACSYMNVCVSAMEVGLVAASVATVSRHCTVT